jgi:VWFA-related protein
MRAPNLAKSVFSSGREDKPNRFQVRQLQFLCALASKGARSALGVLLSFSIVMGPPLTGAQQGQPTPTPSASEAHDSNPQSSPELASHDEVTTFKVNVKLVLARVVVRDSQGHAIGNLRKEDFALYDNKKPQVISQFSIEQPGSEVARAQKTADALTEGTTPSKGPDVPERFIAYVFDDVHLKFEDIAHVRDAAGKNFETLKPTDRAAIFTTSKKVTLDFTDDRAQLRDTLNKIMPHPVEPIPDHPCPYMSHYMADLIINKEDPEALETAAKDTFGCTTGIDPNDPHTLRSPNSITPKGTGPNDSQTASSSTYMGPNYNGVVRFRAAEGIAKAAAMHRLQVGNEESHLALNLLTDVVRDLSGLPGQRVLVFASPGFIKSELQIDVTEVIDHALHSNVMVGTLDARGLFAAPPSGDASGLASPNMLSAPEESTYESQAVTVNDDVLAELADSTGGSFIHNNNDLNAGLAQLSSAPEYSYLLGFSPQSLKNDGSYHSLKIVLKNPQKYTLQARRGYFAPKTFANPAEQSKQEIEEAVFSREEMHDLPVQLRTQYFKTTDDQAKLTVLARVDVKQLHFHKAAGRNANEMTVAAALFDRNGNFVQGTQKVVTLNLKDDTLENKLSSGMTVKTEFDVKPGSYLVRLVVRDSEGQSMSANNGAVEIP